MACRLIEQFSNLNIVSVKITPHFHETTPGLEPVLVKRGYSVFRETNTSLSKDSSRMLRAGASQVFFAKVADSTLLRAFNDILKLIPPGIPIICESPALRRFTEPGLLIIMTSAQTYNNKDINYLLRLPHVMFNLNDILENSDIPVNFAGGRWSRADSGS